MLQKGVLVADFFCNKTRQFQEVVLAGPAQSNNSLRDVCDCHEESYHPLDQEVLARRLRCIDDIKPATLYLGSKADYRRRAPRSSRCFQVMPSRWLLFWLASALDECDLEESDSW